MGPVFDDVERTLSGGADGLISHFDYLNNSTRVEAQRVREIIEDILGRHPESHRLQLISRLRSHDNVAHLSACFELILYEILLRANCTVKLPEQGPAVPKHPDYLVTTSCQESFYLEATIATGLSRQEESARRRLEEAYRAIDSVNSPDFVLTVWARGTPSRPVSGKHLKRRIQEWLAGLDHDTLAGGSKAAPLLYEEHGCRIEIGAIPRDRTRGMANRRAIGLRTLGAAYVQTRGAVLRSVASKATRYGELDRPYVVAVNAMHRAADEHDVIEALLGRVSVIVRWGHSAPAVGEERRNPDGAWYGPDGPRNTRVSAVLSTERLSFWSLGQRRLRLIHNPWAAKPLSDWPLDSDRYVPAGNELRKLVGRSVAELLGLPEGWPEVD